MNVTSSQGATRKRDQSIFLSGQWKRLPQSIFFGAFHRIGKSVSYKVLEIPTADQRHFIITSLVAALLSIFTAMIPFCSVMLGVSGLILGLYGRRATPLTTMATWAVFCSFIGLALSAIFTIIIISTYVSSYLWL